jgi:acetyl-CoA synthetase (ADP-forming)
MIEEIKGYPVLQGARGMAAADLGALQSLILKLSEFVEANPQVEELDLNPVFAYADGAIAVDARIVLEA